MQNIPCDNEAVFVSFESTQPREYNWVATWKKSSGSV
jgi:hypothetical protein